jgi:hypothetical protein
MHIKLGIATAVAGLAAFVLMSPAGLGAAERKSAAITLGPGQAVLIDKTDLICVFGGPANEIGMACLHTKTSAKTTYTFRLDENDVKIYRRLAGKTSVIRTWREPVTRKQPRSPAVSTFNPVGSLTVGGRVRPAGMDIGCAVYAFTGHPIVECAKLGRDGHPLARSYAASAGPGGIEVARYDAAHHPTSLFVGREGTR